MTPDEPTPQLNETATQHQAALLRLRRFIGLIGFSLPIILLIGVHGLGVDMENSISEFFFSELRDVFVLSLGAVGVFLIAYHGHSPAQGEVLTDWRVSTVAGLAALGVALIPTTCRHGGICYHPPNLLDHWFVSDKMQNTLHFGSAAVFLGCLALFCLVLFRRSNSDVLPDDKALRNFIYALCGLVIVAMVILLGTFKLGYKDTGHAWDTAWHFTFWVEAIAVWAFGIA